MRGDRGGLRRALPRQHTLVLAARHRSRSCAGRRPRADLRAPADDGRFCILLTAERTLVRGRDVERRVDPNVACHRRTTATVDNDKDSLRCMPGPPAFFQWAHCAEWNILLFASQVSFV